VVAGLAPGSVCKCRGCCGYGCAGRGGPGGCGGCRGCEVDDIWLSVSFFYFAIYYCPSDSASDFVARVRPAWRALVVKLDLPWGVDSGKEATMNCSSALVLLLLLIRGRTLKLDQQLRCVTLGKTVAGVCNDTRCILVAGVTIQCLGGRVDAENAVARLAPSLIESFESMAAAWAIDINDAPLLVAAMMFERAKALRSAVARDAAGANAFCHEAVRDTCISFAKQCLLSSLSDPPGNALLVFDYFKGKVKHTTRQDLRVRAGKAFSMINDYIGSGGFPPYMDLRPLDTLSISEASKNHKT
jgi:hypothetical protein